MISILPYLLLLLALVFPSTNLSIWNGLPLSSWPEFLSLAVLVPFLFSRELREQADRLRRLPWLHRTVYPAIAVVFCLKIGLLLSGQHAGFAGCYTAPAEVSSATAGVTIGTDCERSFEDIFHLSGETRFDSGIAFGPDSWNLVFLNSLRFNFPVDDPISIPRDRIPIRVRWTGVTEANRNIQAEIEYAGEGRVLAGDNAIEMPPAYGGMGKVAFDLPAGRQSLVVEYAFDDHARVGRMPDAAGPRAQIRLYAVADGKETLLRDSSAGGLARCLALLADLLWLLLLAPLFFVLLTAMAEDRWLLIALAALALLCYFLPLSQRVRDIGLTAILMGGWLWMLARGKFRTWNLYALALGFGLAIMLVYLPDASRVILRQADDDPLTHESEAYAILATGSLEGGEPVFFAQPMYRYVRYTEHALFGDGSTFAGAAQLALFFGGVFFLSGSIVRLRPFPRRRFVAALLAAALIFLGGYYVSIVIRSALSEYLTWSLLLWVLPWLFLEESAASALAAVLLLAFSFTIRTNQLPAVLLLLIRGFWILWNKNRRVFLGELAGVLLILLLPLFHNLFYGGQWVLLTSSGSTSQNLPLPPSAWIAALQGNSQAAASVILHLRRLFLLAGASLSTYLILLPMGLFLVTWFSLWVVSLVRRRGADWLLLSVPIAYLLPHLFFDIEVYYPRLFFAGYLAMAAVSILWLVRDGSLGERVIPARPVVSPGE